MGYYADIYVIKKTRSKIVALEFLKHFLPQRKESAECYEIPQYGINTEIEFNNAEELMDYLEKNTTTTHSIYWTNMDKKNLNRHGMIFYTADSCMIFGISRDHHGINHTENEEYCLIELKDFFNTEKGYITYECPPEDTYDEFIDIVNKFNINIKKGERTT